MDLLENEKKKYFFWWFSSSWNERKKKTELQVAGWAIAQFFLSLSHNKASCIVIGKAGRQRRGTLGHAAGWPRHGQPRPRYNHGKAGTRSREAMTRPAAHARDLAKGECRDTKYCIVTGEKGLAVGECVAIQIFVS